MSVLLHISYSADCVLPARGPPKGYREYFGRYNLGGKSYEEEITESP